MKITTNTRFEPVREIAPADVLAFFLDRAENRGGDSKGRRRERAEALEGVVSRLFTELVRNGALRPGQVAAVFDYDIDAENE